MNRRRSRSLGLRSKVRAARYQRWFIANVLLILLAYAGAIGMVSLAGSQPDLRPVVGPVMLGAVAVIMACTIASPVLFLLLADAVGYRTGEKILMVVLFFIPVLNALALLTVNQRATRRLRDSDVRVGFLGVPARERARLAEELRAAQAK